MLNIHILIVILYFIVVIFISYFTKKLAARSSTDFLIAGRNLGVITCAIVVASEWLGGMSTIGVSEKAFTTLTLQPILYNISTSIGMVIIGFTVAFHYRRKQVHTVSEMIENIFGKKARSISAIAFLIAYICLAYVQIQTCASVVSELMGIDWILGVLLSSFVITVYTYLGGLHAIAITSILHLFVMFFGIGYATINGLINYGGIFVLKENLISIGAPQNLFNPFSAGFMHAFSLVLGGVLGGMAGQASIQPIFAAKDPITAKRAAFLSALIVAPFGIMVAILGLLARTGSFFDIDSVTNVKMILPKLLTSTTFISPFFGGMALAGIMAAILSTVGPVNFAIVTIFVKDIYHGLINKDANDKDILRIAKKLVILTNLIVVPLAIIFYKKAILDAAYISYAIRSIGAIVIILGIYGSRFINRMSVYFAFIGGTIGIFVCIIADYYNIFSVDKTVGAVFITFIAIIAGKLYEKIKTCS